MEFFLSALAVIAVIVGIGLVFRLVRFVFSNYLISTGLATLMTTLALVFAFRVSGGNTDGVVALWIFTALSQLFLMGPTILEVHWDGSYRIDYDRGTISPKTTGGFIGHTLGAFLISAILVFLVGSSWAGGVFILPIIEGIAVLRRIIAITK